MAENRSVTYETLDERNRYEPGEIFFNDWEIVRGLGGGSYGHVYLVEKTDYGIAMRSAMKVIRIPSEEEKSAMRGTGYTLADITQMNEERMETAAREIRTMVELQKHPNVVRCEDFRVYRYRDEAEWDILIRMELLTSLPDHLENRETPPTGADAAAIGLAVSRALEACEKKGLLHRDIKPQNLFADVNEYDGSVAYKLGDFGSARAAGGGSTAMTQRGTELYMSPEMLAELPYDGRTDQYSLGLVMYQLANGNRLPFYPAAGQAITMKTIEEARRKRLKGEKMPAPVNADAALAAIILKACAYRPEDRYATAAELRQALEAYMRGESAAPEKKAPARRAATKADATKKEKPAPAKSPAAAKPAATKTDAAAKAQAPKKEKPAAAKRTAPAKPAAKTGAATKAGAPVKKGGGKETLGASDAERLYLAAQELRKRGESGSALKSFLLAAGAGYAEAQYEAARCFADPQGGAFDPAAAAKWYCSAAEQGHIKAQYALGQCCETGTGVRKDPAEAAQWYRYAAEQGDADAQFSLGNACYFGNGVAKDLSEAAKWYRKAAEQGHADAQFSLGNVCYYGSGVAEDLPESAKWYRKAAEQGHAGGQFNLGNAYYNGNGVAKNRPVSVKWYRKAAEQGHAVAQYNLACAYFFGEGVAKDLPESTKWYLKAAEQGHASAQFNLGNAYYLGNGVTKDLSEAVKWYRKAAEQGDAAAQNMLGACYCDGVGVPEDPANGAKWYRKAAEQGHAGAQFNLGVCYYDGIGVGKDKKQAKALLEQAAKNGSTAAADFLKKHTRFGIFH